MGVMNKVIDWLVSTGIVREHQPRMALRPLPPFDFETIESDVQQQAREAKGKKTTGEWSIDAMIEAVNDPTNTEYLLNAWKRFPAKKSGGVDMQALTKAVNAKTYPAPKR